MRVLIGMALLLVSGLMTLGCEKKEESTCKVKVTQEQLVGEKILGETTLQGTRNDCEKKCTESISLACSQNTGASIVHTCHWKDWVNDGKMTCTN